MADILQISEAASLGLHAMVFLAAHPADHAVAADIAAALDVSEHHLKKVLGRLARAGLIRAVRGPHGGATLARPAAEITLLDVYAAVEGPLAPRPCLLGSRKLCPGNKCLLGGLNAAIHRQVVDHFRGTTLADLTPKRARKSR